MNPQALSSARSRQITQHIGEATSCCRKLGPGLMARLCFAAFLLVSARAYAAVAPPLGALQGFAALGASAVTGQTGVGAVLNGDVGSSPTSSISNFPPSVVLPPYVLYTTAVPITTQAQADATAASINLLSQGPGTILPAQLGGTTLVPGVYSFSSTADIATNQSLTLSGAGVYIFLVGSSLTTNVGSQVVLQNGATPCNVYSFVVGSATLNGNNFPGTVIAGVSVTIGDDAVLTGRAVALTGAVTMPGDGGTSVGSCGAPIVVPPAGGVALGKAFLPAAIHVGGTTTLTITLSNNNSGAATLTGDFTDNLPTGVVIAANPMASTTCGSGGSGGGVVTANAGASTVSLSANSSIPGGTPGACTVSVDVLAPVAGNFVNTLPAGALQTKRGNSLAVKCVSCADSAAIPTLSQWMMATLATLLTLTAFVLLRRHASRDA